MASQTFQQFRRNPPTCASSWVHNLTGASFGDDRLICPCLDRLEVGWDLIMTLYVPLILPRRKVLRNCAPKITCHLFKVFSAQKRMVWADTFDPIPLGGIVRTRNDYCSRGIQGTACKNDRRCRAYSEIQDLAPAGHQGAYYNLVHPGTRQTRVPSDHDQVSTFLVPQTKCYSRSGNNFWYYSLTNHASHPTDGKNNPTTREFFLYQREDRFHTFKSGNFHTFINLFLTTNHGFKIF